MVVEIVDSGEERIPQTSKKSFPLFLC